VEETSHYKKEVDSWNQRNAGARLKDNPERAQQRHFDAAAAREQERLEARDQHAMLQPHVLYVSTKQRGNGVLKFIRNVPYAFTKMVPDYILSAQRCALFLSIKYHTLYPKYIHRRIAELKDDFTLRILLVLVDVDDNANALLFLNKLAVTQNLTLILAWTEEEAARYLETYKAFDGKDASSIQKREQTNFVDQVADFLTTTRSVNKTDSAQLISQFGCLKSVMAASVDELSLCPGLGEKKVKRLYEAFHKPFSSKQAKRRREEAEATEAHNENDVSDRKQRATESHAIYSETNAASQPVLLENETNNGDRSDNTTTER
jgi:DNA excision repair protein ERCC-1